MKSIAVNDITEIDKILRFVHDRLFDLSDISFDEDLGEVAIPMTVILEDKLFEKKTLFVKHWKNPEVKSILRIRNAVSLELNDRDEIQQGCINNFSYNDSVLIINHSVPVDLRITTTSLNLVLEFSEDYTKLIPGFSL